MAGDNKLKVLGKIEDVQKNAIAQEFIRAFSNKYPTVCGELYLGYPIYIDEIANKQTCVDIALISRVGVYIINILTSAVTDYGQIQDDIYAKVESKFKKQPFLFKRRKLVFEFRAVTYSIPQVQEIDGYPLVTNIAELLSYIDETKENTDFSDDLYEKILSGIQA